MGPKRGPCRSLTFVAGHPASALKSEIADGSREPFLSRKDSRIGVEHDIHPRRSHFPRLRATRDEVENQLLRGFALFLPEEPSGMRQWDMRCVLPRGLLRRRNASLWPLCRSRWA